MCVAAWRVGAHSFVVDHNGSTARLLTLNIGLLYSTPLKLPGKPRRAMPRPGLELEYGNAAQIQVLGNDQPMVAFLRRLAVA